MSSSSRRHVRSRDGFWSYTVMRMTFAVDRSAIERVHTAIAPYIRVTPVVETSGADFGLPPFALTFKLEQLQHAGSFKTRGAFANLLLRDPPDAGVAAASGGNPRAAVAAPAARPR